MAELPIWLQPHQATVQPRLGATGTGPVYGTPFTFSCNRDSKTKLVLDEKGEERTSTTTLYTTAKASRFTLGALVTWTNGGSGKVLAVHQHDDGGLGAWEHLEVNLT